jgi:hypothetical protein
LEYEDVTVYQEGESAVGMNDVKHVVIFRCGLTVEEVDGATALNSDMS